MNQASITLVPVETPAQRDAAQSLISEYLLWVADLARTKYGLNFDTQAMVYSDIHDHAKFYPPTGRFYLVEWAGASVGVGCLKRLSEGVGEIQRMYVQPHVRGMGGGRILVDQLLKDAKYLGYLRVRLESLKALNAAHKLYHSVGFSEIDPYSKNSMMAYQNADALVTYHDSAVFMEIDLSHAPQYR